jgi:hypothetical protein
MTQLTRRQLLFRAVPLGVAGIAFARAVRAADACVAPDTESLRASLNYANPGADAAATCAHCAFFTADTAGGACGACKILGGAVDSTGHCDSFSPPS